MSPARRTRRTTQTHFSRPAPAAVVYDLSVRDEATIRVPPGSKWTSGPHWHEAHTEYLQVLVGRARVTLGERRFAVGPDDGTVTVPRGVVHEWMRADVENGDTERRNSKGGAMEMADEEGEEERELVVKEWTEPKDGAKEVFFRNLNGLLLDATTVSSSSWGGTVLELELWNLFWRADNFPVVLGTGWVGGVATKVVMGAAVALGWVLGFKGVYEEYSSKK